MSLEETFSTIPQIPIYTKGVSLRDTFYNSKKLDLYWKTTIDRGYIVENVYKPIFLKIVEGVKRHLSQFPKNGIILKVSLEETPFTIPKNWIYTKGVSWRDTFPQFSYTIENFEFMLKIDIFRFKIIFPIFNTYWILWNCGKCLFKRHL